MKSPTTGRREPRENWLMCTNVRVPPPFGTANPKPLSSFHSVIRPANRMAASETAKPGRRKLNPTFLTSSVPFALLCSDL
jgi:hypothetical protein